MRAIVLDANAFGTGAALKVGLLRRLARDAGEVDMEVWLPEPVAWELAAHVADAVVRAKADVATRNKLLEGAGLEPIVVPIYPDTEALIQRLVEEMEFDIEGVEIIHCSEEGLREALRDQVTVRPPAEVKGGVKTGASDSAWIRAVREAADDPHNESYVVVSNDSAVAKAFLAWGEPPPVIFPDLFQMRQHLLGSQPASLQTALRAARAVTELIHLGTLDQLVGAETLDVRVLTRSQQAISHDVLTVTGDVARMASLAGAEVRAEKSDERIVAWFDVAADVTLTTLFADRAGQEPGREATSLASAMVRVPLLLDFANGEPANVELAQAPWVLFSESWWDDPSEASGDCFTGLFAAPEFSSSGITQPRPGHPWTIELSNGDTLHIVHTEERQGGWRMIAHVRSREITLVCHAAAAGPGSAWVVDVGGDSSLQDHPTFALGEFVLRALLG